MQNTPESPDGSRTGGVQAIARAGQILRALEQAPHGMGVSEVAAAVGLPKSTVHRLLRALASEELVSLGDGGLARLGAGLARLGAAGREALADRLRPVLVELRRELDETVDLSVPDGTAVRFIDQITAPRRLRATSAVGEAFPLHCTANGKALLAAMPDEDIRDLLGERLERLTARTIVSRRELLDELAEVRRAGVAFDREEHTEGICAAGAAVLDAGGAVAAISVPVPSQRFAGREDELGARVRAAAAKASRILGARRAQ